MIAIVGSATASAANLEALRLRPELRKATTQMRLAYAAAAQCLAALSPEGRAEAESIGLVSGTSQGELEPTKEFYKALGQTEVARPFLFQNSLHHSTAGFLSQTLRILGPALTVADNFFSGEAALETAMTLLDAGQCSLCLVVACDVLVPDLESGIRTLYPERLVRGEGAGAILLASESGLALARADLKRARIVSLERHARSGSIAELPAAGYYDSDAIERIAARFASAAEINLPKPDGTSARLRLEAML